MRIKKYFLFLLIFDFIFCLNAFAGKFSSDKNGLKYTIPWGKSYDYIDILVTRVVNVNTLQLENGERVLLIGVMPIDEFNKEAISFVETLVKGKRIQLEFDEKKRDADGRILAYAYLTKTNLFINEEIIKKGFARASLTLPNVKYSDLLLKAEKEAKEAKAGLWR